MTYTEIALKYINDCLTDKILVCEQIKLSCKRFIKDYNNQTNYYYSDREVDRVCTFVEKMTHTKGEYVGQYLKMEPWQVFMLAMVFGFLHKEGRIKDRRKYQNVFTFVGRGNGKALDVTTRIPTPTGWTTMGEIQPGDYVLSPSGSPVKVIAATDTMHDRPCYEIEFADGERIIADEEHLWDTNHARQPERLRCQHGVKPTGPRNIVTTKEIHDTLYRKPGVDNGEHNHKILVSEPLELPEIDLPIHPYVFGYWLGDGTSKKPEITVGNEDIEETYANFLELGIKLRRHKETITYKMDDPIPRKGVKRGVYRGKINIFLHEWNLIGNKHIPNIFLRASKEQRFALLQGLMDSDGYICKRGQCVFTSTNFDIACGVHELLNTLGFKPTIREDRAKIGTKDCGPVWDIQFCAYDTHKIFRLSRKQNRLPKHKKTCLSKSRTIISCKRVKSVPVRCIEVENADGMYLAGINFVRTHNSSLLSAIALYATIFDERLGGARVFCVANSREQARLVFDDSKMMAQASKSKALINLGNCNVMAHSVYTKNNSVLKPISSDHKSLDGLNPSFIIIDEIAAFNSRGLYDVLKTATAKRASSMLWMITTAGFELESVGKENYDYAKKVNQGVFNDEAYCSFIYELDEKDDWNDERVWEKANPNWNISVYPQPFKNMYEQAVNVPSARAAFLTKNLNQWVSNYNTFFDMRAASECIDETIEISDFDNATCYIGLDLASKQDLCCASRIFKRDGKYYIFPRFYLPEQAIIESRNPQYKGWALDEQIKTTSGNILDFETVHDDILEDCKYFDVRIVATDPWGSNQTSVFLEKNGIDAVEIPQNVNTLSEPLKQFDAMIRDKKIVFKSPVLLWNMSNVIVRFDANDNIFPRKENHNDKIDGVLATLNALAWLLENDDDDESVYDSRGIYYL